MTSKFNFGKTVDFLELSKQSFVLCTLTSGMRPLCRFCTCYSNNQKSVNLSIRTITHAVGLSGPFPFGYCQHSESTASLGIQDSWSEYGQALLYHSSSSLEIGKDFHLR